jgi:hypothetical protein
MSDAVLAVFVVGFVVLTILHVIQRLRDRS